MIQEDKQDAGEGPRSFVRFLERLADGQAQADLSVELHELMKALRHEASTTKDGSATGSLTLDLKFKAEATDVVVATYTIKRKEPPARRPNSVWWLTKGANLTPENPRQLEIPTVRDVSAPSAPRDLSPAGAEESAQ